MGFTIWREAWDHAPLDLSQPVMMVLLAIADSAGQETRMTCLSVSALAEKSRASRRTTFRALTELYERGILQNVTDDAVPKEFRRYRSDTRRITEVHHWAEGVPVADYVDPAGSATEALENELSDMGSASVAPNPSLSKRERRTSSFSVTPPARRARPTRAEAARRAAEDEDALDPAKFLAEEPEAPARPESRRGRTAGPDTGMGLAKYFVAAVERLGEYRGLDIANQTKLASTLNRWKSGGTTPDQIRAMVDLYAEVEGLRNSRQVPWVDFLAKRALLMDKLRHRFEKDPLDDIDWDDPASFAPKPPPPGYVPDPIWG